MSRSADSNARPRCLARELAGHAIPAAGPYMATAALVDYFAERERKGSKGIQADR